MFTSIYKGMLRKRVVFSVLNINLFGNKYVCQTISDIERGDNMEFAITLHS